MAMTREQKQKLAREAEEITHNLTVKTGGEIAKAFQAAKDDIDAQLIRWYMRYAINEGVTLQEAQRQLTTGELKEFRMTVEEYIKKGRINAYTGEFEAQLERASIARHVTRLEALKVQVAYSLEELRHRQSDSIQSLADTAYTDRYYRTLYGIHLDRGVGYTVDKVATSTINALMTVPWAPDGVGLSERIYKNTLKAEVEANREILQGFIQGKSVERMSRSLRERLDISHANANRLVRTESAHFANAATFDAYEKEEIEKYQFLATLDDRTSDICQSMDLQVFPVADMEEGVNAPPMHVNCRSTTVAFDEESKNDTRIARNIDGKNIQVPGDMSYKEWHDKYIKTDDEFLHKYDKYDVTEGGKYTKLDPNMSQEAYEAKIDPEVQGQFATLENPKGISKRDWGQLWDSDNGYIQSDSYTNLNNAWRKGGEYLEGLNPQQDKTRKIMEKATQNHSLPRAYIGTRKVEKGYINEFLGIDVTGKGYGFNPKSRKSAEKAVVTINRAIANGGLPPVHDKAVTSISLVEKLNYFNSRPVQLELQLSAGTKGIITDNYVESEFIAKSNSSIDILGAMVYDFVNDNKEKRYGIKLFSKLSQ